MSELIREATRDGQRVALLRCWDGEGGVTLVEAEVTPATGASVTRGPYRFRSAPEAFKFVQETLLALQYLGCRIG